MPLVDVLAELTGLGPPPPDVGPVDPVAAVGVEDAVGVELGAFATQMAVPAITTPTSTTVRIWVERGRLTK
jgi:hypothetical protein